MTYFNLLRALPAKADRARFKVERWATPDEGLVLAALAQCHGVRSYLEAGTANGFSSLWAAAALDDRDNALLHTWDPVLRAKIWEHHAEFSALGRRITCHGVPFHEGVGNVHAPAPRLFFIDGHHSRTAVRRDWRAVRSLIEPGDVVVFHDANEAGVASLCANLRTLHGYRGGIVRTARGMGVYFA